ncbi:Shedu immune nuclease family protein [Quadrisphaera sp. KR29]|uniref:Shedu immune nuclease family protein n=1 Tax=Quadrisphaera sp. KR29 TaxID=3461391 RepID=UPI00404475B4
MRYDLSEPATEVDYALGRRTDRFYINRSFVLRQPGSQDDGEAARYIYKVFDETVDAADETENWDNEVFYVSPKGRTQLQLQVARTPGGVRKLRLQRVTSGRNGSNLETLLTLDRSQAASLIQLIQALQHIPADGDTSEVLDDSTLSAALNDPRLLTQLYSRKRDEVREHFESDESADDILALARRRAVVQKMELWLADAGAFAAAVSEAGGPERAWQHLLEANPWILGVGLGGQLLTSWDDARLEQRVTGQSVSGVGKTVDALLKTQGAIQSLVFAEIKHQNTPLLAPGAPYRSGCHAASSDLMGAITQVHQTVDLAVRSIGEELRQVDEDGGDLPQGSFLLRPKSYLIVGSLEQLVTAAGGIKRSEFRSFQLLRRSLTEPEIITFDELLEGARCHVQLAEKRQRTNRGNS